MSGWADDVLSWKSRWAVTQGDCLGVLSALPADSVNLIFGSPPYVDARLYLENGVDLGIARGPEDWTRWMIDVFFSCRRVCVGLVGMVVEGRTTDYSYDCAPDLLRADLKRSGFVLRKSPIYRRNGIPGSGGPDWLRNDYEPIVCTTRGGKLPWSDNTACGHPPKWAPGGEMSHRLSSGQRANGHNDPWLKRGRGNNIGGRGPDGAIKKGTLHGHEGGPRRPDGSREVQPYEPPVLANPGNVPQRLYTAEEVAKLLTDSADIIDCKAGGGNMGSDLAHENEAPFPLSLAEFFVLTFAPPGGLVLDPFCGSGTVLEAAVKHGRRALGIDLRQSQVELTRRRLSGVTPGLWGNAGDTEDDNEPHVAS